jgi:hypothetical protein
VELRDELERIAAATAAHGKVSGVLAAEPAVGRRLYLVAFGEDDGRHWLVVDEAANAVDERGLVREVASIVVLCELAEELAGGGELEELRARLAQLRVTEQPAGIEAAEQAALELERAVGVPPRVASPGYLDAVGAAAVTLEHALGNVESPFSRALRSSTGAVDAFIADVEQRYRVPLRSSHE